jgi:hypothetical protein
MVQVIEQGDIFGKVGKAFGEGLGEAIPKEMDQYLLSKQVQRLRGADLPREKLSFELANLRYGTPEQRSLISNVLMREADIKSEEKRISELEEKGAELPKVRDIPTRKEEAIPDTIREITPKVPSIPSEKEEVAKLGKVTPGREGIEKITHSIINPNLQREVIKGPPKMSEVDYRKEVKKGLERGFSKEEARAEADKVKARGDQEYQDKVNELNAQKEAKNFIDTGYIETLGEMTQKTGKEIYQDVPGRVIKNVQNKMYKEFNEGGDPAAIVNENAALTRDYITADKELADMPKRGFLETTPEEQIETIQLSREPYEKLDALDVFEDRLRDKEKGLGLGEYSAAAITYPLNDETAEVIDSIPDGVIKLPQVDLNRINKQRRKNGLSFLTKDTEAQTWFDADPKAIIGDSSKFPKYTDEEKLRITKSIDENTSIRSLMLKAYENRHSDKDLKNYIMEANKKGLVSLTERQKKEIRQADQISYSYTQIAKNWLGGLFGSSYKKSPGDKLEARLEKR